MSQSRNLNYDLGSIKVMESINLSNTKITNLSDPVNPQDAVTKNYVDNSVVQSNLHAGIGITIDTNNDININNSQTQITALGNINIGTWSGSTINIGYGGTGQTSFTSNRLLWYDGMNSLVSASQLIFDTMYLVSSVPIYITNTTNSINNTTTGSLIVAGGALIKKDLYVNGNSVIGNITVGNITINGTITLNSINSTNAFFTSITTSTLNASTINLVSYFVSPLTSTNNLLASNSSLANTVSINNTLTNMISSSITTASLNVPGVSILSTSNIYSISSGLLNVTNSTMINAVMTNISVSSLRSSNINATNLTQTNLINTNITSSNILVLNLNNTFGNISNLTNNNLISTNSSISNINSTNILSSNISASNMSINNTINSLVISTGNIYSANALNVINSFNTNMSNTNLSNTNLISNSISVGSLKVSNSTNLANTSLTNLTSSSIFITNNLTSTFNTFVGTSTGSLNVSGISIFATTTSTNTSTGTIQSNTSITNWSSTGSLNVLNNITTSTLSVSGLSNQTSILASNISTNSLNVINQTNTNLINTNITNTNLINTNLTTTNIFNTNLINTNLTTTNIVNINITNTNLINTNLTTTNIFNTNLTNTNLINTNITISNSNISNSTIGVLNVNNTFKLSSNYQGGPIFSFFNISNSFYTNNTSTSSSNISFWYANFIGSPTLIATNNNITTQKCCSLYIQSNVLSGANQTLNYNSNLSLGYISNSVGSILNGQIMFERADGNWYSSIYVENSSNKLIIANGSGTSNAGIGLNTVTNTPIVFNSIISSVNTVSTPFIQFLNTTTNFYSTIDAISQTTASLVLAGGLSVQKTLNTSNLALGYQKVQPNEGDNININTNYAGLVLQPSTTINNLILTLPTGLDGQCLFITTNKNINNITFSNCIVTSGSLSSNLPLRFMYVSSGNLWYNI